MASGSHADDVAAIRAIDADWAKAAAAKDAAATAAVYTETGALYAPGAPPAVGRPAIEATFAAFMALPGFALTFVPSKIEVASGGDMAYEIGDYALTVNGADGKPQTAKANYVVVWGKQADGRWKALVDVPP
jgi:uncharacterized protein (TIGR02246 family)